MQPAASAATSFVKRALQARFDHMLTSDKEVANLLDEELFAGRTLAFDQMQNARIQATTAAQVIAALKKYVRPDALVRVKAGDLKSSR